MLDNSGSTVAVHWQASAVEPVVPGGALWAAISPASGAVPAHGKQTITVNPDGLAVCKSSSNGRDWHVRIVASGVGTYTFTYTVS
jgi:hypothetical protein